MEWYDAAEAGPRRSGTAGVPMPHDGKPTSQAVALIVSGNRDGIARQSARYQEHRDPPG